MRLFNGYGGEYLGRLQAVDKQGIEVQIGKLIIEEPPSRLELNLLLGISKGERMDFAIQKAVELGVTHILPMFTARSVVRLRGERLERRRAHWRKIIIAACEQSGRCRLPRLEHAMPLAPALDQVTADLRLLLHHKGAGGLDVLPSPQQGIALVVGPEGGLELGEIHLASGNGFLPVRLGPRIMRTETAPLAALAAIQTLWGDFRTNDETN